MQLGDLKLRPPKQVARMLGCKWGTLRGAVSRTKHDAEPLPVIRYKGGVFLHLPTLIEWSDANPETPLRQYILKRKTKVKSWQARQ